MTGVRMLGPRARAGSPCHVGASFLRDRFVQVEEDAGDYGVGGPLGGRDVFGEIWRGRGVAGGQLVGVEVAVGEAVALLVEQREELLALGVAGVAGEDAAEGIGDALVIGVAA